MMYKSSRIFRVVIVGLSLSIICQHVLSWIIDRILFQNIITSFPIKMCLKPSTLSSFCLLLIQYLFILLLLHVLKLFNVFLMVLHYLILIFNLVC